MIASILSRKTGNAPITAIALLLATGLLSPLALQAADPASTDDATAVAATAAEATVTAAEAVVATEPPQFGPGMQIPVDGSSLEAFDKSLEEIKAAATAEEFTTLQNALDWHLLYDLAARRDRAKMANNLDGLTGEEIVEKVRWK